MWKSIGQIRQIFYTTKHCEFTRHWIHFDFGFRIYRDLTKSATFQFGFTYCICLNQGSFLFSVGWEGRGGGVGLAIWRIGLPLKKVPGYLPDFYHIFCNTIKTYPGCQRLVASAYGRRCVGLRPTPKIPAAREKNLWYPG